MNIQIYFHKKTFDVQKAERWFKERRVKYQLVDLKKARIGPRELKNIADKVGVRALIDIDSDAYKNSALSQLRHEHVILDALLADPRLMRVPIVRNGQNATVGYAPDVWEVWAGE